MTGKGKIFGISFLFLIVIASAVTIILLLNEDNTRYVLINDEVNKKISFSGVNYNIGIDYDGKFKISSFTTVKSKNLLAPDKGISLFTETDNIMETSLQLQADPAISINDRTLLCEFSTENFNYKVSLVFYDDNIDAEFGRTYTGSKNDTYITSQGFPSFNFEQDAVESIRWKRSGANFWIGGKAKNFPNFLSANDSSIARAMEDICFTILAKNIAVSFDGEITDVANERPYLTVTDRYDSDDKMHLGINVNLSPKDKKLAYATGTSDGWPNGAGGLQGKLRDKGGKFLRKFSPDKNNTDIISFKISVQNYSNYYDLGELKGINEKLLSGALNDYGRLMIMDWNMGTTVENPNKFFEIPALEQHWNTNILGILRDDNALNSQKNGLMIIRDRLQAKDGHIASPYVGMGLTDSWGSSYSDTEIGYVIAVCELYDLTGDLSFLQEMHESIVNALDYTYKRYFNKTEYVINNLSNWDFTDKFKIPANDYWEHGGGKYNGYTTAMYYDALTRLAIVENILGNTAEADSYLELADKVKAAFNKVFWSEKTNTYLYGTGNYDICYLPVQGAAMKTDLVSNERKKLIINSIEKEHAVFDLTFHVMNVRDILNPSAAASQEPDFGTTMMGMNGGWYGAPDGDFYSGIPAYGDRTLIPRYINGYTSLFEKTGFIGASTYFRDGVTPADYGWMDCMPTFANVIWGLYTFGYGFQPDSDRLIIAPFIDKSMEGSIVKYRWRQTDLTVKYNTIYSYTLDIQSLPTPVYFKFINQTPGKTYSIKVDNVTNTMTADEDGNIFVRVEKEGKTTVKILDPDKENNKETNENIALNKPVSPSSIYDHPGIFNWPTYITDGLYEDSWKPDRKDKQPYIRIDLGRSYDVKKIKISLDSGRKYYYIIEGTNNPTLTKWDKIADRKLLGKSSDNRIIEETLKGSYSYIRITFYKSDGDLGINEVEIY